MRMMVLLSQGCRLIIIIGQRKPVAVASCNVFFLKSLSIFSVAIYDPPDTEGWFLQPKNKVLMYEKANQALYGGGGVYGKSTSGR
jgi:hypothetical protein